MDTNKSNEKSENDVDKYLQIASRYDDINRKTDLSYELSEITKETAHYKIKLQECRKECEQIEMEHYDVHQLIDKGLFVLKNIQRRNEDLHEDLKEIHCNYVNCLTKSNDHKNFDETVSRKIKELTAQRDGLKEELAELNKIANQNGEKLLEIKTMIVVQEKKNIALLRKLKRTAEGTNITPDLIRRINSVLSDPRITKANVDDKNVK